MEQLQQVLYLGPLEMAEDVRAHLGAGFQVSVALDELRVKELLPQTHVILDAYMRVSFCDEMLSRASKLRLVVTGSTGADHFDNKALARLGVPLLSLRGQHDLLRNLTPAAEHSWLLLLACARNLRPAVSDVLEGTWDRNRYPGIMLRGKTLGIIGCGRIGRWMAHYAHAFGMNVLGCDPQLEHLPEGIERCRLHELLASSDFVTVHVPFNEDTRGLLGKSEFAHIKPGTIIINTSRGAVIDEQELLAALKSGRVRAAGLDVLEGEPNIVGHPLAEYAKTHSNVIVTPHIGGFSPDALKCVLVFCCRRIRENLERRDVG